MLNCIPSLAEYIYENISPSYKKEKEEAKKILETTSLISIAGLTANAAFAVMGLASGGLVGSALILVSLPTGYLSYNTYILSKNLHDIVNNPQIYKNIFGFNHSSGQQKLREKLKSNTIFGFSFFIDYAIEDLTDTPFFS